MLYKVLCFLSFYSAHQYGNSIAFIQISVFRTKLGPTDDTDNHTVSHSSSSCPLYPPRRKGAHFTGKMSMAYRNNIRYNMTIMHQSKLRLSILFFLFRYTDMWLIRLRRRPRYMFTRFTSSNDFDVLMIHWKQIYTPLKILFPSSPKLYRYCLWGFVYK